MAITASSIVPSNNLEDLRQEFNNLVVDVTAVAATNTFDTSIIFEGSTADAYETTLTVTDPTADRTITLPNVTGTVLTTANSDAPATTTSTSDVDFILVDDGGVMKKISEANLGVGIPTTITLAATNTTDAAHYPLFSSAATGNEEPRTDTGLTYNPSSEILHVGKLTVDDAGTVGSASSTSAITIASDGELTFVGNVTSPHVSSDTFGVPITMNRSAGAGTDANDNIVQNTNANDGDRLLYEDAVFDTSVLLSSHGVTLSHQRMDTTGAASAGISALTDGAIIAADCSIFVTQDGTGSRTLSFASYFHFPGGTAPTMTTTAAAVDRIDYAIASATSIHAVVSLDVKATS